MSEKIIDALDEWHGGWCIHENAIFKKGLKIPLVCDACKNKFIVERDKNVEKYLVKILDKTQKLKQKHTGFIFSLGDLWTKDKQYFDEAISFIPICPHCKCVNEEIMCEPTGKKFDRVEYSGLSNHQRYSEEQIAKKIFKEKPSQSCSEVKNE